MGKGELSMGDDYKCGICVSDVMEEIELTYHKDRNMWTLKKER